MGMMALSSSDEENEVGAADPAFDHNQFWEKQNEQIEATVKWLANLKDDCLPRMRKLLIDVGQIGHNKSEFQLKTAIDDLIVPLKTAIDDLLALTVELEKSGPAAEKCMNTMHCKELLGKIEELNLEVERHNASILKPIRILIDLNLQMKDVLSKAMTELPKSKLELESLVAKLTQSKDDITLKLSDVAAIESGHGDDVMLEYELRSQNAKVLMEEARKERKQLLNEILHAGKQQQGVLNLIDLAGSEDARKSGKTRETGDINKSLTFLKNVIREISNRAGYVSFRSSKLTHLLQPCLGGQAKVLMIVNLSPEAASAKETLSSLLFASDVNKCIVESKRRP